MPRFSARHACCFGAARGRETLRKLLATAARPTLPLSAAVFALGCAANIGASGEADTTTEDVGVEQSAIQLAQLRIGPFADANRFRAAN